jgi:hypothetical protein
MGVAGACLSIPKKASILFRAHQRLFLPSSTELEMKGIVVFDDRSDLAFYSLDKEMERYVKDRVRQLEDEAAPSSVSAAVVSTSSSNYLILH